MYGFIYEEPFSNGDLNTMVLVRPGINKKILLIHGIACTKEIWFAYPILFPSYYFIAYDQRGFGDGDCETKNYHFDKYVSDAISVIHKYNPDLIIGHSFGGAVAQKLSHITGIPAIILESTANPPRSLTPKYREYIHSQMVQAIWDSFLSYMFSPGLIMLAINLLKYNPDMPAMGHMAELLDFNNLCDGDKDSKIIKVMGGTRDDIATPSKVKYIAQCANRKAEIYNVNHLGILYPHFVLDSLRN